MDEKVEFLKINFLRCILNNHKEGKKDGYLNPILKKIYLFTHSI